MSPQLILIGAPGSGKGTQAKKIVNELGYNHVSTGDLLRAEVAKGSELGTKIKEVMDSGELVSDELVLDLLKANCAVDKSTYIFDGYPRNLVQAKDLDSALLGGVKSLAVYFEVNIDTLVERIVNRRVAPKSGEIYNLKTKPPKVDGKCDVSGEDLVHRKDDNEETVRTRMKVFTDNIEPVLEYYESQGRLVKVDATKDLDAIFEDIKKVVK
ncbi:MULTISPECIES: adenylate kinase [Halobacteriovorax]|uniref:Adenylate kinase n=1 Tax=Halobacteriovorax vibrionivorans TaxID=2152716 RepID=A0ABY0IN46_9BACT|nr:MULTISPECIES: adenylate kinase [Halobacteriovorax]AYF45875.1 putative adenylate kinase [Halobacteriovorax sp. BALOs_7]RZF22914.1 adenylate kinase [Halobacteriovorax vibrionivorans]TGD47293.1 adenylate kinase [Halobacteriovorax sp. Y22]